MGNAMILVLFIVCVLMHCVLVIAASVFDADFPDQADHCLVMMMGKHGGEYDHQHRHQGRDYRDSLHHDKNRKITRKCEILRRKVVLHTLMEDTGSVGGTIPRNLSLVSSNFL